MKLFGNEKCFVHNSIYHQFTILCSEMSLFIFVAIKLNIKLFKVIHVSTSICMF